MHGKTALHCNFAKRDVVVRIRIEKLGGPFLLPGGQPAAHVLTKEMIPARGLLALSGERNEVAAVDLFLKSAALARGQGALAWELRAAMNLPQRGAAKAVKGRRSTCWWESLASSRRALRLLIFLPPGICWTHSNDRRASGSRSCGHLSHP